MCNSMQKEDHAIVDVLVDVFKYTVDINEFIL